MWVRYWIPAGPRCFRWRFEIWSGPSALEALLCFIAFFVSSTVYLDALDKFLVLISLVMILDCLELVWRTTDEN